MVVRQLFALMFAPNQEVDEKTTEVLAKKDEIDALITKNAPEWPIDKLNRTDLGILRLAVYELMIEKKEPIKVIIDEAVELAKEMGSENSPGFVNGVLGSIIKDDPRLEENEAIKDYPKPDPGTTQTDSPPEEASSN